ncbi:MAG: hypothetical protein WB711_24030 [Terriglobales bacterium]
MTADDRLALIRVKIKRAYQHLDELEYAILSSDEVHFNSVGMKFDSETGSPSLEITPLILYDPDTPAIAGDVIHNLRSALDHLTFQLVEVGGARQGKMHDIRFPIFPTSESYEAGKMRKIEGMRREAIEAIDRLKPYKGGNDALWLLSKLDNTDKHSFFLSIGRYQLLLGVGIMLHTSDPFFSSIGSSHPNQNVDLSGDKPLSQPAVGGSNALLPTLHQLAELVGNIVTEFRSLLE